MLVPAEAMSTAGIIPEATVQESSNLAQPRTMADDRQFYVTYWIYPLSHCYDAVPKSEMVFRLLQVHKKVGDKDHPMEASTINPSSNNKCKRFANPVGGNVGIETTTPTYNLHVKWYIRSSCSSSFEQYPEGFRECYYWWNINTRIYPSFSVT
ncbi:hypothetical protein GA0116948_109136 [Chitinophaga costaii]|uniref:Uncharacterized protein n=1 Tax=Chitinophaga costaii TaxID=1335309 RepID=A0A1C4ER82_9BACT|nr:hypothetical protein DCM91_14815 [Chitinophaga costaii]SCC46089.1 hypothetical protein GA0116948_109136 [Chitinophaga costaii]